MLLKIGSLSFVQSLCVAMLLLAARMIWTGGWEYRFLAWNLVLVWVPFICALIAKALHERKARGAALLPWFVLWLLFLPNAPYVVTDFMHLRYRLTAPLWFDALMLATYAWAGVGVGIASLRTCARIVAERRGRWVAALFVLTSAIASGFGIYLGRFLRLNSWDVATQPLTVLSEVAESLSHPRAWVVTAISALFFLAAYGVKVEAQSGGTGGFTKGSVLHDVVDSLPDVVLSDSNGDAGAL